MTAYTVYRRQLPTGGTGRWLSEVDVFLIWGPITQIRNIKTIATVGSRRAPDLKKKLMGSGDARHDGPRSGVGRAVKAAHEIAAERGYRNAAEPFLKFGALPGYRDTAPRKRPRNIPHPFPAQRRRAEALGVHPRHSGMPVFANWSTLERAAAATLVLYRQGVKATPERVGDILSRVYQPASADDLRALGGPEAVTIRVETALGFRRQAMVGDILSAVLNTTSPRQEAHAQ